MAEQNALYYATALYDYVGASEHELSFYANDTLEILEERGDEWVYGRLNGYVGCVPRNYIQVCDDNTYYENYDEGVDESAAAGSKESKQALEKEIAELEKKKQQAEDALTVLNRMGGNDEALYIDLNRLCLLLEAHIDTETELKAANQVLQNELTNLRGVLQTLKLASQFDLQKKKTEEKLEKMLSEIQSSDSSLQAAVNVRNDLLVPIQKLTSSIKV